jgi:ectoine hydroxylase-related dioxygenase (phytanoyl-CoA dioxygenase family)
MNGLPKALRDFKRDGFVVIENAISRRTVTQLQQSYGRLLRTKIMRSGLRPVRGQGRRHIAALGVGIDFRPEGGNHDLNRWNMHLPSAFPFFKDEVLANHRLLPLLHELIGPDAVLPIIASDTPLPGSGFQNIHQDHSVFRLTVNIPLVHLNEHNGPIEVWSGTHVAHGARRFSIERNVLAPEELEHLIRQVAPQRLLLRAGSLLVRDQRLAHRGTPNHTSSPRPMLTLNYGSASPEHMGRALASALAAAARTWRQSVRGSHGAADPKVLDSGNALGRAIDYLSQSDRDDHRAIPETVWKKLGQDARTLLRFATRQGIPAGANDIGEAIGVMRRILPLTVLPLRHPPV